MSDPNAAAESEKHADLSNGFMQKNTQELAAIKARLIWLLMPAFLVLLAVLGISLWTFFKVADIQTQVNETDRTLAEMRRAAKAKQLAEERANLIFLPNGLSNSERADFYHLAEGSEVYPLTWMKALETENGKLFLEDVERMGFLPDPDNKDGLPVGLTSGVTIGLEPLGPMVGLNCAACHVGELHYQGKRIRIDGAPNLLNTREFFKTLIDSALSTAKDPAKLIAFLARVKDIEEKTAGIEPSKARLFARGLLVKIAKREEEAFKAILQPVVEKLIRDEAKLEPFNFKTAFKDGAQDKKSLHDKITKDLAPVDITGLLGKSTFLKSVASDAEHRSALTQTLHDIYISIRLLRARAVFLEKLGPVGMNPRTNWGPGRVDAFGSARTFLFDDQYEPINPVSYPPIFELGSHNWFHYDNNTNTFLERNFGQALGVGAVYDPKTLNSTLQVENLRKLEAMARKLTAPKWPEDVFGKIDPERAARGAKLYSKYCADCHDAPKTGEPFAKLFDLDDIKTDPERAKMFAEKLPKYTKFPDVPFSEAIKSLLFNLKTKEIANFPLAEKKEIEDQPVDWRGPGKYSARTLKGSWATAPYLHNGSVPTMDDLLQPAKDRPTKFNVGNHQYDPEKLGYVNDDKAILYDTATQGNSNSGHEGERYGTTMSAADRKDLLEYLKTH